jgi:hypothetical protein
LLIGNTCSWQPNWGAKGKGEERPSHPHHGGT